MTISKYRLRGLPLLVLALVLSFVALILAPPALAGGTLRVAILADPITFDPTVSADLASNAINFQLYDNLFIYNRQGKLVPFLAEGYVVSPDAKVYTFKLRKGVKFHNGREFTAEDVRYTFERALVVKGTTASGYFEHVVGGKEFIEGKTEHVTGMEVLDKHTFRIRFTRAHPAFAKQTAPARMAIVNRDNIPDMRKSFPMEKAGGTGAFILVEGKRNFKYTLKPFKDYWHGSLSLDRLELVVAQKFMTAMDMYENNELDLVTPPVSQMPRIRKSPTLSKELLILPRGRACIIAMNYKVLPQWNNKKVRLAFIHAIDTKTIAEVALEGMVQPARSCQPPISYGRPTQLKALEYDPEKARRLLAEAGYPGGKGFPALTLLSRPQSMYVRALEAAAGMLQKNLGVEVRVKPKEFGTFIREVNQKNIHAFFLNCWTAAYLDPEYHLSDIMTTGAKRNRWNYSDKYYDSLIAKADTTVDEEERMRLYLEAEEYTINEGAVIPLYYDIYAILVKPWVKNVEWSPTSNGFLSFWSARIEK